MTKKKQRALLLIELLAAISIMGLVATVIGVSIYDNFFQPEGGKKAALLISTLSTHAQGWAIQSGQITIMEVDLSQDKVSFYNFNASGEKIPIPADMFKERKLPDGVKFVSVEMAEGVMEDGKVQIPYFSSGYSKEGMLIFEDNRTGDIWTIYFMKFYGDTKIYNSAKTLKEVAVEDDES